MRVRGQFAMGCPLAKNIGNSQSKYGTDRYSIVIYCESNKIQLTYKTVSKDMNVMKITCYIYINTIYMFPDFLSDQDSLLHTHLEKIPI